MNPSTARIVYQVIGEGLKLKESLERKQVPNLLEAQGRLLGLLGGLGAPPSSTPDAPPPPSMQYALVCWLDETFNNAGWAAWGADMLEPKVFNSAIGGGHFWTHTSVVVGDVLEVYYLCVVLGFRGTKQGTPLVIQDWLVAAREQLASDQPREWPGPGQGPNPRADVPPLTARAALSRLLFPIAILTGLLLCVASFVLFKR